MNRLRPLELWGGIECTVNRIGDCYSDQIALSGHAERAGDLDRIAALGIKTIRYPVIWEQIECSPSRCTDAAWSRSDWALDQLKRLEISPILGLIHHGSGPRGTSLVSPDFASGLAAFARRVAERYPWVTSFTPVNEPLTTARFSCLYGHWYPHAHCDRAFVASLLNQCRAIVEAMSAIREITPHAQLIQTENLDKVYGTKRLQYQVEFENLRRWLSIDLLMGRVDARHPLRSYLHYAGATAADIDWFLDHSCTPDMLGWNYYLTSERFLDERVERYPNITPGGNGRDQYVDVEAVRVRAEGIAGWTALLREAWQRYGIPLALTEVHLGCHRESQLRWLLDAWQDAQTLRDAGIDVRAVTSWSLLGSFGWNSLCTANDVAYESGAFDIRNGVPRPTALVEMLGQLSSGASDHHPVIPNKGWWETKQRLLYPAVRTERLPKVKRNGATRLVAATQPILILGAQGNLGRALSWCCRRRNLAHVSFSRRQLDVTDSRCVEAEIVKHRPWAIVNAAGYSHIDRAEIESEQCRHMNTTGATVLAEVCAQFNVRLLTFSSDLVFDGASSTAYIEADEPHPLNIFGATKADADRAVSETNSEALTVRCGPFFSPWNRDNFLYRALERVKAGHMVAAANDWIISPTYVPALAHACLDLLIDRERGLWHLSNIGAVSWAEVISQAVEMVGMNSRRIEGRAGIELQLAAPRPRYSPLSSTRGLMLPKLSQSLERFCDVWKRSTIATRAAALVC